MNNKILRFVFLSLLVSGFSIIASAQTAPGGYPNVKIENFGQMREGYYRGAQPKTEDYKSLKEIGVVTVIDLRGDSEDWAKSAAETAGLRYFNIPMSGYKYPKEAQVEEFLKLLNDPETGTVYVHCKAGIHRTGITGAVYRFTKYGWDYDQVYKEMKNYDFSAGLWHRQFKKFVKDYAKRMEEQKAKLASEQAVSQTETK
jgi:tyrosine-protein phosphatase SIW14